MGTTIIDTQNKPFGTETDVSFAKEAWKAINGYDDWKLKTDYYYGQPPHGKILRTYFNIVKDNFAGDNATIENVQNKPFDNLVAITIMIKKENGYDQDNQNWFWVKYTPQGMIAKNEKEMLIAGRVAKRMNTGCIHCHSNAAGNDYVFFND